MKKYQLFLLFLLLGNFLFILVNIPIFLMVKKAPPGTFYPLIHQGHMDYYLYLSAIRESLQGSWVMKSLFSSEQVSDSFFYVYFIALGKLGRILHLNQIVTYHLGRIISTEFLIVAIFLVCHQTLKKNWAFWAGFVSLFSTVPPLMFFSKVFGLYALPSWWVSLDALGRMDYLPHHSFGIACLFFSIFFLFRSLESGKRSDFIWAALMGFVASITFPPCGLLIALGVPLSVGIYWLQDIAGSFTPGECLRTLPVSLYRFFSSHFFVITLSAGFGLFLMRWQSQRGFPWSQWKYWEMGLWNDLPKVNEYLIIGSGFVLLFSLPLAIHTLFTSKRFEYIFLSVWAILPYLLLGFTDIIGISRVRMAYMGNFLPLGILSVTTVQRLTEKLKKKQQYLSYLFFIVVFTSLSLPVNYYYFRERMSFLPLGFLNLHIPAEIMKSIFYLGENIAPYSVILSEDGVGGIFPAFIPVKSYYAHVAQTKDYGAKTPIVHKFYSGKMAPGEALRLIRDGKIDFIYVGPIERSYGGDIKKYNLSLQKIYNQEGIEIYKVENEVPKA